MKHSCLTKAQIVKKITPPPPPSLKGRGDYYCSHSLDGRGQGGGWKIDLFILNLAVCILILLPLISQAAYKIYLKNGRAITGVNEVKEEDGKIRIYKSGIMLELQKANILKIEEYEAPLIKEERVEEKAPAEEQPPAYLMYEEPSEKGIPEKPLKKIPPEKELEKAEEPTEEKLKTTGAGEFEEGELKPGPQLKELQRLEEEGKLPEQFKSYKDFLEKQYKQQKKHVEGQ